MIRCSNCNNAFSEPIKCVDRPGCRYPEYFKVMHDEFRISPPPKRYCSLTGGVNSGKTFYLMSLIYNLLNPDRETKKLLVKIGIIKIEVIDPISNELFDRLMSLYRDGQLEFTVAGALEFFNLIITLENNKQYEVVLFNSSGENIENWYGERRYKGVSHEMKGSTALYFLDPREDSKLNKILDSPKSNRSADYRLANYTYEVFREMNKGTKFVTNPLAVCISKFDLLLHRIPHEVPQHPFVEAHNIDFFEDIERTSEKLKAFLQHRSETVEPEDLQEKFRSVSYFAVAPFGSDDKPACWDKRNSQGILAPFFWALKEQKIITEEYGTY